MIGHFFFKPTRYSVCDRLPIKFKHAVVSDIGDDFPWSVVRSCRRPDLFGDNMLSRAAPKTSKREWTFLGLGKSSMTMSRKARYDPSSTIAMMKGTCGNLVQSVALPPAVGQSARGAPSSVSHVARLETRRGEETIRRVENTARRYRRGSARFPFFHRMNGTRIGYPCPSAAGIL